MPTNCFRVDDVVKMSEASSKYTGQIGVVTEIEGDYVRVLFADNEHTVRFPCNYFTLFKRPYTVSYSYFYSTLYKAASNADIPPSELLDRMPHDLIEIMAKNNLFITYEGM